MPCLTENSATTPVSFPQYWAWIRQRIDSDLERRIPQMFAAAPGPELEAVLRAMDDGKRIRGCLVCLMCNALGGRVEAALSRAAAVECVHAASLIHDDYIDRDRTRRGRPAGWVVDGGRRAVLVGDVMFATAIEQMAGNGAEEGALIAATIAEVAHGAWLEQSDVLALAAAADGRRYEYAAYQYDDVVRMKTAVLFAAAARFGAIAADAPAVLQHKAFEFGMRLGEAYQLADDLMEVHKLEHDPRPEPQALLELAPVMLRFSTDRNRGLERLNAGNLEAFKAWVLAGIPSVRTLMTQTIAVRERGAVSPLAALPDNAVTRMLYEMPAAVTETAC